MCLAQSGRADPNGLASNKRTTLPGSYLHPLSARERPFAKDIFGSVYDIMCEMEWLRNDVRSGDSATSSKEVPLCLTGTVSKICWRFCTDTLRRRLTRLGSIVVALSMATCQWDLKSTAWTMRVNSLLLLKALGGRIKLSLLNPTNTPIPRCALFCP